jgi:hypothetical protein
MLKEYVIQLGANMLSGPEIECSFIQNKMEPIWIYCSTLSNLQSSQEKYLF